MGPNDWATSIAIQPDGKIVVGGTVDLTATSSGFAVARLDPDGSLDPSFDGDGKVTMPDGAHAESIALQPDGKIVLVGGYYAGTDNGLIVARLQPDGTPDSSFGDGGRTKIALSELSGTAHLDSVVVQPDGKIVVAGPDGRQFAVARLDADGSIDTSFGSGGTTLTSFVGSASPSALVLTGGGKILVAGGVGTEYTGKSYVTEYFHYDFALARYGPDGSLDPSFGQSGTVRTNMRILSGDGPSTPRALLVQPDGKVLVAADSQSVRGGGFAVARFDRDGSPDPTFGTDGAANIDTTGTGDVTAEALAAARQPDGKILVAGCIDEYVDSCQQLALARFNADGSPDPSFATNAVAITDFKGGVGPEAIAVAPDGGIVLAVTDEDGQTALIRYRADGELDPGFAGGGVLQLGKAGFGFSPLTLILGRSGRIIVAGGDRGFRLAAFRADGSVDRAFGHRGRVGTQIGERAQADGALALPRGRILVYGEADKRIVFARYRPNGSLDRTFGRRGKRITSARNLQYAQAATLQRGGKIVMAGSSTGHTHAQRNRFELIRFTPAGHLDHTFGSGGIAVSGVAGRPIAVAAQRPHQLVVAGSSYPAYPPHVVVARFKGGKLTPRRHR